LKNTEELS